MPTVGYLEGVDPLVLTRLAVHGVGTLPVSNGFDSHGKFINAITERDAIDLIVGYLHKLLRTQRQGFLVEDLLDACYNCQIPILAIVPREDQERARQLLGPANGRLTLIEPQELYDQVVHHLGLGG
ncbi:MAG TPA: hypothetical protein VM366_15315 [Anaerolineae bacterium]|nr:hypothetical protein [Anaerolineae bacterium]